MGAHWQVVKESELMVIREYAKVYSDVIESSKSLIILQWNFGTELEKNKRFMELVTDISGIWKT